MLINVFDTAIDSDNLGDHFIMEAVWDVLRSLSLSWLQWS